MYPLLGQAWTNVDSRSTAMATAWVASKRSACKPTMQALSLRRLRGSSLGVVPGSSFGFTTGMALVTTTKAHTLLFAYLLL